MSKTQQLAEGAKQTEMIERDQSIVIRGKDGEIRRIKSFVDLSVEAQTMVGIIRPYNNRPGLWTPSAKGYGQLGAMSGLAYRRPETIIVDGKTVQNPGWSEVNKTCYSRTQVGGYTALGQPVIVDRTVEFSVHRYNVQDLLSKAKRGDNKKCFQMHPFKGLDEHGCLRGAPGDGIWAGYRLDEAVVLWMRTDENPDIYKWYSEINNRLKNALRTVQTFSDRNAVAAHPTISPSLHFECPAARVKCISWFAAEGNITFDMIESHKEVELLTGSEVLGADDTTAKRIAAEAEAGATDPGDIPEPDEVDKPIEVKSEPVVEDGNPAGEEEVDELPTTPEPVDTPPKSEKETRRNAIRFIEKCRAEEARAPVHRAHKKLEVDDDVDVATLTTEKLEKLVGFLGDELT